MLKCIAKCYEDRLCVCVCVWTFEATLIAIVSISYEILWISLAAFPRKQKTDKKKVVCEFWRPRNCNFEKLIGAKYKNFVFPNLRQIYTSDYRGRFGIKLAHRYQKKGRLLKIVMCGQLALPFPRAFLQQPLRVLTRETRQTVQAINQSIFL
jgi:hypothetical protein